MDLGCEKGGAVSKGGGEREMDNMCLASELSGRERGQGSIPKERIGSGLGPTSWVESPSTKGPVCDNGGGDVRRDIRLHAGLVKGMTKGNGLGEEVG